MPNPEQSQFLEACQASLKDGTFKRVVLSRKTSEAGGGKYRASFDLVVGGKKRFVDFSDTIVSEPQRSALDVDALLAQMEQAPIFPFQSAVLFTESHDFHYAENRKGHPRVYRAKASMKGVSQDHNRAKNYVLNAKRPYLKGLGVTSDKGEVIKKQYGKFRQIANFVEIIDRDIGDHVAGSDGPISMLDLGCGKGYLTFAAYDYLRSRAKTEPRATGIDIKKNVIDLCNSLSDRLGFDGLTFQNDRIEQDKPVDLDILIALHACDTATDDALALGLRSNMQFFFCAPCCQAQIAAQILAKGTDSGSDFDLISQFPLMRRREADVVTDVARALLLQSFGYAVKFLEFTPLEHTLKNVMLAGRRDDSVDRDKALAEYRQLKKAVGFEVHALEENTRDLRG
ncbi:MAG: methyltransferase [Rhizobiaceae bacterium]|nr:methyltransferase [Rhizobiaceae bacterium]